MKKVSVLSLAVLATVLLTFANSSSKTCSLILNNKFLNETENEAKIDIENEITYNNLIKDFNIFNEVELERNIDDNNNDIYLNICNDFKQKYIKETIEEEQKDITNNSLYTEIIQVIK